MFLKAGIVGFGTNAKGIFLDSHLLSTFNLAIVLFYLIIAFFECPLLHFPN